MLTFAGKGGEADAFDGTEYNLIPVYVLVLVGVFFAGCCFVFGYYAGRRAGWRDGVAVGRALQEAEMKENEKEKDEKSIQADSEDEPEGEEQRRARYANSEMCEVSDPKEWMQLHHGEGGSEAEEEGREQEGRDEVTLDGVPGRPTTSTRFTPAELRYLVATSVRILRKSSLQTWCGKSSMEKRQRSVCPLSLKSGTA